MNISTTYLPAHLHAPTDHFAQLDHKQPPCYFKTPCDSKISKVTRIRVAFVWLFVFALCTSIFNSTVAVAAGLDPESSMQYDDDGNLIGWGFNQLGASTSSAIVSSTSGSSILTGMNINQFLGADTFYNNGFTGTGAIVANFEAGHVWNGHETLSHVTTLIEHPDAIGDFDRHATWVASAIAGRMAGDNPGQYQQGIAYGAELWSGALATQWNGSPFTQSFNFSINSLLSPYRTAMIDGVGLNHETVDVINSSWVFSDPTGSGFGHFSRGIDALVNQSGKTVVVSAGNRGSASGAVGSPGAGYNVITVGGVGSSLGVNPYDTIVSSSSRGPNDLFIPSNVFGSLGTTINGVRAVVDIVAPGDDLTLAYYGGTTGGNAGGTAGPAGSDLYQGDRSGTSFSSPLVAGGATLIADAAKSMYGDSTQAVDGRVMKAILLNSADKITNWDNGQQDLSGVITTTQSLDYTSGAGRLNLDTAYHQLTDGVTDVDGLSGGNVERVGWDFAEVSSSTDNDYHITQQLQAGETMTVTLDWFVDRTITSGTTTRERSFDNLDLQIWKTDGNQATQLVAESISLYNNVEHLSFDIDDSGFYLIRVQWVDEVWDLVNDANQETYGLAWNVVPEPNSIVLLMLGIAMLSITLYRKRNIRNSLP